MPARALMLALLLATLPAAAGSPPVWPLDLGSRHLTSNFMERRPGRYHAGLDLKTESRTGFAVRAVEDGHITRVRAEAGAYGRAVYVEGASGLTTVYAHLECFSDRIAALVAADRATSGVYRVRLDLPAGRLPVAAGEVLGLSGESGTSGPHLHFEVRDAAQRPLNPLDWGFAVADTFAPVITAVTAHAADAPADGSPLAAAVRGEAGLRGRLPALTITGPVAFSARITDQADHRGHVLEPWLIEVFLDGASVYRCRNERFAFGANNQLRLEWCDLEDPDGRTVLREHWLFRRDGVTVPGREGRSWHLGAQGRGLTPGEHLLEIVATDRAGGRTAVTVPLVVLPAGEGAAPQRLGSGRRPGGRRAGRLARPVRGGPRRRAGGRPGAGAGPRSGAGPDRAAHPALDPRRRGPARARAGGSALGRVLPGGGLAPGRGSAHRRGRRAGRRRPVGVPLGPRRMAVRRSAQRRRRRALVPARGPRPARGVPGSFGAVDRPGRRWRSPRANPRPCRG